MLKVELVQFMISKIISCSLFVECCMYAIINIVINYINCKVFQCQVELTLYEAYNMLEGKK